MTQPIDSQLYSSKKTNNIDDTYDLCSDSFKLSAKSKLIYSNSHDQHDNFKNEINDNKSIDIKKKKSYLSKNSDHLSKSLLNKKQNSTNQNYRLQSLMKYINRLLVHKHLIIMLILNILMLITLTLVYTLAKPPTKDMSVTAEEIILMKRGKPFGGPGGEKLLDDAEAAKITLNDTITKITLKEIIDQNGQSLLLSLTATYSNSKSGYEYGALQNQNKITEADLELRSGEHINKVIVYEDYRNITNIYRQGKSTYIIVGIHFKTNYGNGILLGSSNGKKQVESYENYFLAYVQGKSGGYIDSLCFTWYRYQLKNTPI